MVNDRQRLEPQNTTPSNLKSPMTFEVNSHLCNIRESIGNGFHTLDRMYTMYTYPSYDRLLSTIGLSLETGAREARMNESGQLVIQTLVPSGLRKLVVRNS